MERRGLGQHIIFGGGFEVVKGYALQVVVFGDWEIGVLRGVETDWL